MLKAVLVAASHGRRPGQTLAAAQNQRSGSVAGVGVVWTTGALRSWYSLLDAALRAMADVFVVVMRLT